LTGLGDVVATRYVRHLYENFYAKGQKDLKSINLEMTFVTAGLCVQECLFLFSNICMLYIYMYVCIYIERERKRDTYI
jgi:hypothetical protein